MEQGTGDREGKGGLEGGDPGPVGEARVPEVEAEDEAGDGARVPLLVLEAVVEDDHLAQLPVPRLNKVRLRLCMGRMRRGQYLVPDADAGLDGYLEAEVGPEAAVGGAAVGPQPRPARQHREGHGAALALGGGGEGGDEGAGAGRHLAVASQRLPLGVEEEPLGVPAQHHLVVLHQPRLNQEGRKMEEGRGSNDVHKGPVHAEEGEALVADGLPVLLQFLELTRKAGSLVGLGM